MLNTSGHGLPEVGFLINSAGQITRVKIAAFKLILTHFVDMLGLVGASFFKTI